jgi:hypothetical protein
MTSFWVGGGKHWNPDETFVALCPISPKFRDRERNPFIGKSWWSSPCAAGSTKAVVK